MTEDNYIPSGKIQGDTKDIPMTGEAQSGNYDRSLGGMSRSVVQPDSGFKPMGDISNSTKSDNGRFA